MRKYIFHKEEFIWYFYNNKFFIPGHGPSRPLCVPANATTNKGANTR